MTRRGLLHLGSYPRNDEGGLNLAGFGLNKEPAVAFVGLVHECIRVTLVSRSL